MLLIAICDDEETTGRSNALIVQGCLNESGFAGAIRTYTKSDNLLYDITEDRFFYDLILLDIEMPGPSGMELAAAVRPFLPDVKKVKEQINRYWGMHI